MADYAITSTAVLLTKGTPKRAKLGTTIAAGELAYKKSTDGLYYKADNNVTIAEATGVVMVVQGGATGQDFLFSDTADDEITCNAVGVLAEFAFLSANAGKACPIADLVSTNWKVFVGYWRTTSILVLKFLQTGLQVP